MEAEPVHPDYVVGNLAERRVRRLWQRRARGATPCKRCRGIDVGARRPRFHCTLVLDWCPRRPRLLRCEAAEGPRFSVVGEGDVQQNRGVGGAAAISVWGDERLESTGEACDNLLAEVLVPTSSTIEWA